MLTFFEENFTNFDVINDTDSSFDKYGGLATIDRLRNAVWIVSKMDDSLLEASADLGASRLQTFWKITFPLSLSGVVSGITLVFLPAVSSFFIPKLLGGGQFFLIGNVIENQFITVGEWNFGSAISMIMAVMMMVLMMVVRKMDAAHSMEEE